MSGKVTVNTAPVVSVEFVTDDHTIWDARLVEVISFKAAPLNGHCNRRFEPLREVLIKSGAAIPPTASATGRTLPPASKNDAVLKPASLTPLTAWYSVPQ